MRTTGTVTEHANGYSLDYIAGDWFAHEGDYACLIC